MTRSSSKQPRKTDATLTPRRSNRSAAPEKSSTPRSMNVKSRSPGARDLIPGTPGLQTETDSGDGGRSASDLLSFPPKVNGAASASQLLRRTSARPKAGCASPGASVQGELSIPANLSYGPELVDPKPEKRTTRGDRNRNAQKDLSRNGDSSRNLFSHVESLDQIHSTLRACGKNLVAGVESASDRLDERRRGLLKVFPVSSPKATSRKSLQQELTLSESCEKEERENNAQLGIKVDPGEVPVLTSTTKRKKSSAPLSLTSDNNRSESPESLISEGDGVNGAVKRKKDASSITDLSSKRRTNPGVRVVGGRIYDSENGVTCHQCRQKTLEVMAVCTHVSDKRVCVQKFCPKCLLNRYGEKVEESIKSENWRCPRCRGICNCSICMKKKGLPPTGLLSFTAKAAGFDSVADLLEQHPDARQERGGGSNSAVEINSQIPRDASTRDAIGASSESPHPGLGIKARKKRKAKKEKTVGDTTVVDMEPTKASKGVTSSQQLDLGEVLPGNEEGQVRNKVIRKRKLELGESGSPHNPIVLDDNSTANEELEKVSETLVKSNAKLEMAGATLSIDKILGEGSQINSRKRPTKEKLETVGVNDDLGVLQADKGTGEGSRKKSRKMPKHLQVNPVDNKLPHVYIAKWPYPFGADAGQRVVTESPSQPFLGLDETHPSLKENVTKKARKHRHVDVLDDMAEVEIEIVLPKGESEVSVAGLQLPAEAVGPALQFMEFSSAFRKPLRYRKGEAERILKEMALGGTLKRGGQSELVQLHVQLLTLILEECGERVQIAYKATSKNSWLQVFRKHMFKQPGLSSIEPKLQMPNGKGESCSLPSLVGGSLNCLSSPFTAEEKDLIENALNCGVDGYGGLTLQTRLQLLNILCDDTLSTLFMREHLDEVASKFEDSQKENREEFLAYKKQVRDAIQKQKDVQMSQILSKKDNVLLSSEEEKSLLTQVQCEAEKVVAAKVAVTEAATRMSQPRCDAVRTEPIAIHKDGGRFWKLNGASERSVIIFQDLSNKDLQSPQEATWSAYSSEQHELLLKYISSQAQAHHAAKKKSRKAYSKAHTPISQEGTAALEPTIEHMPGNAVPMDVLENNTVS